MRMLLAVAILMQGVWFFFSFAVNRDSGTHPNKLLGIILPQNNCQNECDSKSLEDRASTDSGSIDKEGVVNFKDFTADGDFGTYHMLFLRVKLPLNN